MSEWQTKTKEVLGPAVKDWYEDDVKAVFALYKPVTFGILETLAKALGTDRININPGENCHESSYECNKGSPAFIEVLK